MLEYYTISNKHIFEGVEVLRYRITLPAISDAEEITVFYREIGDAAADFCSTSLTAYAEERYAECELPKKKFVYAPLCYELEGRVTYEDGELIFIMLRACTHQRLPQDSGTSVYDAHAWSLTDKCLLPPRYAARSFLGKRRLPRDIGKNGFLVDNGIPYICYPDRSERLQIE